MTLESDQVTDIKVKDIDVESDDAPDAAFVEELGKQFGVGSVPKRVLTTRGFTLKEIHLASKEDK